MATYRYERLNDEDIAESRKTLTGLAKTLVEQIQTSDSFLTISPDKLKVHLPQTAFRCVQIPWTHSADFDMHVLLQNTHYMLAINRHTVHCDMIIAANTDAAKPEQRSFPREQFNFNELTLQGLAAAIQAIMDILNEVTTLSELT